MLQTKDIETVEEELHGFPVITVNIRTKKAAEQLKRTVGSYITIETKTVCAGPRCGVGRRYVYQYKCPGCGNCRWTYDRLRDHTNVLAFAVQDRMLYLFRAE